MTGELNPTSKDLLYVGTNELLAERVRTRLPTAKFLHITNHTDLERYLIERRDLFSLAIQVGKSRSQTENAVYPSVIMSEPEFPEFPDGNGDRGDGVSFLSQIKQFLPYTRVYLVMPRETYSRSRDELVQSSNEKGILFIEENELETRVEEFIGID